MLFLLIAIFCFVLQLFLPWWIIAPVAFALAIWKSYSGQQAFWSGFGAIASMWAAVALFIHFRNEGVLTAKIAALFSLPLPELMVVITAIIGGVVGGLSALTGFYWRKLLNNPIPVR